MKKKFEEDLAAPKNGPDYSNWPILCEALAKYPTKETFRLFKKVAYLKDEERYQNVGQYVLAAINKYPSPVFTRLKKKIKLDESHQLR